MSRKRTVYSAEFKTKLVLEVLRNDNTLNGDIKRIYEPLESDMTKTLFFNEYLNWLGDIFSKISNNHQWIINLHPYRIIANELSGKPTPEGLHRDGVDFVTSLLVNRKNIKGGLSTVTDNNENLIANFEMKEACDLCLFNDPFVKHGVSEIKIINEKDEAYRDVFVVAFERYEV